MAGKVLLIDDETDILELTKVRLEASGYEILIAKDAREGLSLIQKEAPDLILLDLLLPGIRGEEFCRRLKSDEKLKHIPVILFTASASDISKVAREVRADDYIMKPFEPQELIGKVKRFIG